MKNPVVTIEMENGDIMKAELYPEIADVYKRQGVSDQRIGGRSGSKRGDGFG